MPIKTKLAIIFITFIVISSIATLIYSLNLTKDLKLNSETISSEEITVDEIVITETKDATKYWEVYAKSGIYEKNKSQVKLREIVGNFYKEGKVVMSFEAPEGSYESKLRKITLSKNASVLSEDNVFITADELIWEGSTDKIYANGNVTVNKADEITTISDHTIFNKDFTEIELTGNTNTKVYVKE